MFYLDLEHKLTNPLNQVLGLFIGMAQTHLVRKYPTRMVDMMESLLVIIVMVRLKVQFVIKMDEEMVLLNSIIKKVKY